MSEPLWTGGYVANALGVAIHSDPASAVAIEDLVGLALRRNPKRAHLLVSQVLAKHVPTEPALVIAAGELLGAFAAKELFQQVPDVELTAAARALTAVLQQPAGQRKEAISALTGHVATLRTVVPDAVVIGYAETATGLGRLVANALGAYYIHSTRHATPGVVPVAGFEEGHSHATSHAMVPTDPQWLDGAGPVILVDDELSTGSTVINTIRELHALVPHPVYVVAALIDLRSAEDRSRFDALAAELDCRIAVAALGTGRIELGADILGRAATLIEELPQEKLSLETAGRVSILELASSFISPVRSDRFGNASAPLQATVEAIAEHLSAQLEETGAQGPFVVLGCEENMFLPLAVAQALGRLRPDGEVRFSTTTRSPIVPVDRPDYAIASALVFASHDLTNDGPGIRFAYNLSGSGQRPGTIVAFPEPGTERTELLHSSVPDLPPLAVALRAVADDAVVVLLPVDNPANSSSPSTSTPIEVAP
ncbi:phosphoribosyltransferase domain-containing protein [Arthrobacter sp. TWP1-1]|uniref:phosphoribosyltransferase domain-containing protein n=1 Tax=Arthrobacter sp. TWP1-1 TaxID=2804568 RepID=UPI003CE77D8F